MLFEYPLKPIEWIEIHTNKTTNQLSTDEFYKAWDEYDEAVKEWYRKNKKFFEERRLI